MSSTITNDQLAHHPLPKNLFSTIANDQLVHCLGQTETGSIGVFPTLPESNNLESSLHCLTQSEFSIHCLPQLESSSSVRTRLVFFPPALFSDWPNDPELDDVDGWFWTVRVTVETPSTNLVLKRTLALLNIPSFSDTTINCKGK